MQTKSKDIQEARQENSHRAKLKDIVKHVNELLQLHQSDFVIETDL